MDSENVSFHFYSLFHPFIYLLDILCTKVRCALQLGYVHNVSVFRKCQPFLYHAGYCKKVAWVKTDNSSFISIQRFVSIPCICYFLMLLAWWYVLHCSQMLYLIPCSLSGANLKVCNLSPFICCFSDQIRKGPSPLMVFFNCRATWH
jgi:hypothetical protein